MYWVEYDTGSVLSAGAETAPCVDEEEYHAEPARRMARCHCHHEATATLHIQEG